MMSEERLPRIYTRYLEEDPFDESDTRKIKYFYQSKQHIDAIERIHSGMKLYKQSLLLLTGEVGSGKTFTSTVIMTMLKNDRDEHGRKTNLFAPVFVEKSYEKFNDLLSQIIYKATGKMLDNPSNAVFFFDKMLNAFRQQKKHLIVILDESQNYDTRTLDQIRELTNINTEEKCISILFVGQPELRDKISRMKQLSSRIKVKQYLNNLNESEVPKYIIFRMQAAGYPKDLENPFLPYTSLIYNATLGMPRQITTICGAVLYEVDERNLTTLAPKLVKEVIKRIETGDELH
jgi:general secretion pathway protein A